MNARIRGLVIFAVIVVVAVFACGILPFVMMPGWNIAMALPIITVPGEIVTEGGLFGVDLTNTLIGIFVADAVVIILALLAWRSSKGWTKEVPGRFQAFMEVLVEGIYGFLKNLGGERLRTTPLLWPLVATIFFLLLAANMVKLVPGVESVGKTHCAHVGFSGYPISPISEGGSSYKLHVDAALNAGYPQSEEQEHLCVEWFKGYKPGPIYTMSASLESDKAHFESEIAELKPQLETATGEALEEIERELHFAELQLASVEQAIALAPVLEAQKAAYEAATAAPADDGHGAATDDHSETATEDHSETAADHSEEVVAEEAPAVDVAALKAELDATQTAYNLAVAGIQFPGATLPLTQAQIDAGAFPYIFHITPFVRGAASDLSLTIAYAIMAVIAVQVYGVYALGPAYFEKFVNLSALGNLSKRPLGAIDFVVGLFEIISEFAKIISLAFRLFGNIFAGGVALIAISFLVATLVPGVILLLELVIGAVQALVFSVLTLVFVVQAMEHHGGGDDHGHGHDEAHGHGH
jgi:F0F1-type ATP synthase membrane subunit a